MKAAVLPAFNAPPELQDLQLAALHPTEVRIRTAAVGVCHSDRHGQNGGIPSLVLPSVLGHEAAGVVTDVGASVTYVQPGDHVVVGPAGSCGMCDWCSGGQPQHCTNQARTRLDGTPRLLRDGEGVTQFVGVGGFAEALQVPVTSVVKVPSELPLDVAALLGCAVITGLGAVRHAAGVRFGDTVAVIGCGGVGLSAVQGALLSGAARVIAVDRMEDKLTMAKAFGATDTVNAAQTDPVAAVRALTGGVDHVIEAVGVPATISQAWQMLGVRGTATVVGLARPGDEVSLPTPTLLDERRLQGSRLGGTTLRVDIPLYARMYLTGRLSLDPMIGARTPLAGLGSALEGLGTSSAVRTVITF